MRSNGCDGQRHCYCGSVASIRTSWSEVNPGRRFVHCPNKSIDGRHGCNYFDWVDGPVNRNANNSVRNCIVSNQPHLSEMDSEVRNHRLVNARLEVLIAENNTRERMYVKVICLLCLMIMLLALVLCVKS